jgi:hypothetical protein
MKYGMASATTGLMAVFMWTCTALAAKTVKKPIPPPKVVQQPVFLVPGIGCVLPARPAVPPMGTAALPTWVPGGIQPLPALPNQIQPDANNPSVQMKPGSKNPLMVLSPSIADALLPSGDDNTADALALMTLTIANPTTKQMSLGVVGGKISEAITLRPAESLKLPISFPPPEKLPGVYDVSVKALQGDKVTATIHGTVCVPFFCRKAALPVRINADLGEWGNATSFTPVSAVNTLSNISARALMEWDSRNLYLAITEKDTHFSAQFLPDQMLRGDSIEIGLDASRNKAGDHENDKDVYHFGIAQGRVNGMVYCFSGPAGAGHLPHASASIRRVDNLTIYEIAIPWSEIPGFNPIVGNEFGFAMRINDPDGNPPGSIQWGDGVGQNMDPGRFFCVQLLR